MEKKNFFLPVIAADGAMCFIFYFFFYKGIKDEAIVPDFWKALKASLTR